MKRTTFPFATGGSPIISYLPQNLRTVLKTMSQVREHLPTDYTGETNLDLSKVIRILNQFEAEGEIGKEGVEEEKQDEQDKYNPGGRETVLDEKKHLQRGWVGCDGVG
jgi:indoleamine 2,3-dioxygenase